MTMPLPPPPKPPAKLPPKGPPPKLPAVGAPPPRAAASSVPTPRAAVPAVATPVAAAASATGSAPPPLLPRLDGLHPTIGAMLEAIQLYRALLTQENAMLRAGDSQSVSALLDRKLNATQLYQDRQRTLLNDPDATRSLTSEQRAQLVAAVRSLEDLAQENTVLLKANMSAIQQLFEVINTAARKMRKREVSYSQGGVIHDYHLAHTVSLAYNHVV